MMRIQDGRRGVVRGFSLAAAAMLVLSAVPDQRAEALSLANPASVPAAKHASDGLTTEVRGGHGGHGGGGFRGGGGGFRGGGGFHGGGFRGGGAAIHAGGFRHGGAVFRGGGLRAAPVFHGGFRHGGFRFAHHRRHFHRHFYYAPSYVYYPRRYCRIVWTYYGPHKICRYRPWHHHWRHRHHRYPIYW